MKPIPEPNVTTTPFDPFAMQAQRIRRRISTSDSVAMLLAERAYGDGARDHEAQLAALIAKRATVSAEVRR